MAEPLTPATALDLVRDMHAACEAMLDAGDDVAAIEAAAADLGAAFAAYDTETIADATDPGWPHVAEVLGAFVDWLEGQHEDGRRASLTRDEKIKAAVAVATRGRGRGGRRNDAIEKILSALDAGAAALARGLWTATNVIARAAGKATLAVGQKLGEAVTAGAIHVDAYMRDGKEVAAHDRRLPAKAKEPSMRSATHLAVRGDVVQGPWGEGDAVATDDTVATGDDVEAFIAAAVEPRDGGSVTVDVLYAAFSDWCAERGLSPMGSSAFQFAVQDLGYVKSLFAGAPRFISIVLSGDAEAEVDMDELDERAARGPAEVRAADFSERDVRAMAEAVEHLVGAGVDDATAHALVEAAGRPGMTAAAVLDTLATAA